MTIDPTFCALTPIQQSVKVETVSSPELGFEQLCLRVKAYCGDCKEAFVPLTSTAGFSTSEIGVIDSEVFIPLEYPIVDEIDVSPSDVDPAEIPHEKNNQRDKEFLH